MTPPVDRTAVVRALLLVAGGTLLVCAALYGPTAIGWVYDEPLTTLAREKVRTGRLGFVLAGALLVAAAEAVRRSSALRALVARRGIAPGLLALLSVVVPLAAVDCGFRPFLEPKTSLFVRDDVFGWRLARGAEAEWGGVRVRTNAAGLRGPEIPAAASEDGLRILFLGDSVTFGYGIERVEDVFPQLAARALETRLGSRVASLNAGVGGWSPWQQLLYLEREGLAFEPDLVVVGFVLNDVTEKLSLVRYGGRSEGWQLHLTARSAVDRWLSGSAVVWALRRAYARARFGADVPGGALAAEAADIKWLAEDPDRPELSRAWTITLGNLDKMVALAGARGIPLLLVVFPYEFQLGAPVASGGPQARVVDWAEARGVPVLDLLPVLARAAGREPFRDASHLSVAGHRLTAGALVRVILENGWLTPDAGAR